MAASRAPTTCPCGSGERYVECCGSLHAGLTTGLMTAPTAERLMRSRYSAFVVGDVPYLLGTWHPTTRPPGLTLDAGVRWQGLRIVATTAGGPGDLRGTVTFVARFRDAVTRTAGEQREHSAFVREGGRWLYVGEAS